MKANSKSRAIVCLDGEPPSKKILSAIVREGGRIVAADGGANWLFKYGITPDVVIGDLDGIQRNVLKKNASHILRKPDQYSTDFEKTMDWLVQEKVSYAVILGMAGKRIDHTLSNFSIAWKYKRKMELELRHDDWTAYPLENESRIFQVRKKTRMSLIPYSNCHGITLRGFQYPLTNANSKIGGSEVSNIAIKSKVRISVRKGKMLAVFS